MFSVKVINSLLLYTWIMWNCTLKFLTYRIILLLLPDSPIILPKWLEAELQLKMWMHKVFTFHPAWVIFIRHSGQDIASHMRLADSLLCFSKMSVCLLKKLLTSGGMNILSLVQNVAQGVPIPGRRMPVVTTTALGTCTDWKEADTHTRCQAADLFR